MCYSRLCRFLGIILGHLKWDPSFLYASLLPNFLHEKLWFGVYMFEMLRNPRGLVIKLRYRYTGVDDHIFDIWCHQYYYNLSFMKEIGWDKPVQKCMIKMLLKTIKLIFPWFKSRSKSHKFEHIIANWLGNTCTCADMVHVPTGRLNSVLSALFLSIKCLTIPYTLFPHIVSSLWIFSSSSEEAIQVFIE